VTDFPASSYYFDARASLSVTCFLAAATGAFKFGNRYAPSFPDGEVVLLIGMSSKQNTAVETDVRRIARPDRSGVCEGQRIIPLVI